MSISGRCQGPGQGGRRGSAQLDSVLSAWPDKNSLSHVSLLRLIEVLTHQDSYMLKDVVTTIGCGIEQAMHSERLAWLQGRQIPRGAAARHLEPAGSYSLDAHEMASLNLARVQAIRNRVAGSSCFSMSADAAKVGFKTRQNTAFIFPGNFATWGPPTALWKFEIIQGWGLSNWVFRYCN